MAKLGTLHCFPTPLSQGVVRDYMAPGMIETMSGIDQWIVETPKTARAHLKAMLPDVHLPSMQMASIDKHTSYQAKQLLEPCLQGHDMGLISDAGSPAIADPGNLVVSAAHALHVPVKPWSGPNSIMMLLMATGFNGQHFQFHGYLPHDKGERKHALRNMEQHASRGLTQLWIETPFRSVKHLEELSQALHHNSLLAVGCDLTGQREWIRSMQIKEWKDLIKQGEHQKLNKRPCVFAIGKPGE
ncbi:MAG: SAM-dependent methyltransferase [Schleiferiaceae bacterium]|nr:SAM-dependent methyltransferase [Schleiferiaceae bacterium]MDO7567008.1 SAM-dependent methyltransferase [Schleiferiaceae bacterium]MDO7583969.1 SAM-dependent methyltransferase [Schleiferiaceae bacterium]MDO7593090.1 SAM-dependent methyltransferase [Schleiferiaceae bacterium]MDO7601891.1 SAM-dependent methyltransferase [Schleiferiaceae bacterium]